MFKLFHLFTPSKMESVLETVGVSATVALCTSMASLLLIKAIILRWKNRKVYAFMASMPGPASIPFFGNAFITLVIKCSGPSLFQGLRECIEKYPKSGAYWVAHIPYLTTSDPKVFNAISMSMQNINKTKDYDHFKAHCAGIFTANGEDWRRVRKIINPSFRTSVLASFGDNFSYHTQVFLDKLEMHGKDGRAFNLFIPVHLSTIDLICDNMMGCRMDVQEKNLVHLSTNLEKSTEMLFERSFNLVLWSDFLYSVLGKQKQLHQAVGPMRALARQMLEQATNKSDKRNTNNPTEGRNHMPFQTFMRILLENIESSVMTYDQAVEEIIEMFIAGSITTATTSAWALKIMAMEPEIQEKVRQEAEKVRGLEKEIDLAKVSQLSYLDAVVKETLRHFAVPFVTRHLVQDLKIDDKTTIPAGIRVMLTTFFLHHDPEYWERPGEFYPEHFSQASETKRPKGVFVPFMCGPRICPGNKYAMQSVKLLIANTLLKYEFLSDEKMPADFTKENYRILFMLWPASGFHVRLKRRSQSDTHMPTTHAA